MRRSKKSVDQDTCPAQGGLRDALDIGIVMNFDVTDADEMAALVLDRVIQDDGTIKDVTRVRIRDMGDRSLLNVITFSSTNIPKGMALLPDLPLDNIAVLLVQPNGKVGVKIKDADTKATLKYLRYFPADWDARAIIAVEDMNSNGSWEVGVLAVNRNTHQARLRIKDSETGETVANIVQ